MNDYSWNLGPTISHAEVEQAEQAQKKRKSTATGKAHYYGDWNKEKQDKYNKWYYQNNKDKWGITDKTSKEDKAAAEDYLQKAYEDAMKRIDEGEDPESSPYFKNLAKNTQAKVKKMLEERHKKTDASTDKKKEEKKDEDEDSKKKKSSGSGSSGSSKKSSGSGSSSSGSSGGKSSSGSSGHKSSGGGKGSGSGSSKKSSSSSGSKSSSGSGSSSSGKSTSSTSTSESSDDKYHAKFVAKTDGDSDFDSSKINDGNKLGSTNYHGFSGKDGRDVVVAGDKKWILPEGRKIDDELTKSLEQFDSYLKELGSYSDDFYNKAMALAVEDDMTGLKKLVESEKEMQKQDDEIGHSIGLGAYWLDTVMHADDEDKQYGIPQQKKFPLDSRAHVISAIKFFNYVSPVYRRQLASAIIRKIHEYGIKVDAPSGSDNLFYRYYKGGER